VKTKYDRALLKVTAGLSTLAAASAVLLGAAPAQAACPNEAIREAQASAALPMGSTVLPDCMALEMVSPPKKYEMGAVRPSFSLDGERILFSSTAALAETPGLQSYLGDRYVASRTGSGWSLAATSPAASAAIVDGGSSFGGPTAFGSDLSRWDLFGATQAQGVIGAIRFYHGDLTGSLAPFSPLLVPINHGGQLELLVKLNKGIEFKGASADLTTVLFNWNHELGPWLTLFAGDPTSEHGAGDLNQYVVSDAGGIPAVELLARDRDGRVWGGGCGTRLGFKSNETTIGLVGGETDGLGQGAISADGSRIYFTTRPAQPEGNACDTANPLRILERMRTPSGPSIRELVPGGPAEGSDQFQGASVDGSMVYFTTTRKLVPGDQDSPPPGTTCSWAPGSSAGCDLYLYDATLPEGERLIQVSAGGAGDPTPGAGADVFSSVPAISADGSHAYFVAQGVLTTDPNPEGEVAVAGKPNLYMYERDDSHPNGRTAFIGTLSPADKFRMWGVERSYYGSAYSVPGDAGSPTGGDGHILVFASKAALTAGDVDGERTDVFRYDAGTGTLQRVSVAAPGGNESATGEAKVNVNNVILPLADPAQEGRWASDDGETIAFLTDDQLDPRDTDEGSNAYVWRNGIVSELPGSAKYPPVVSASGTEVGYVTGAALLPQDGDTAPDVYVARADGGFPPTVELAACDPLQEDACRHGIAPPAGASAATTSFAGSGNVVPPPRCRRHFVRRHGKCGRRHTHGKHRHHKKRQAGKGGHRNGGSSK